MTREYAEWMCTEIMHTVQSSYSSLLGGHQPDKRLCALFSSDSKPVFTILHAEKILKYRALNASGSTRIDDGVWQAYVFENNSNYVASSTSPRELCGAFVFRLDNTKTADCIDYFVGFVVLDQAENESDHD